MHSRLSIDYVVMAVNWPCYNWFVEQNKLQHIYVTNPQFMQALPKSNNAKIAFMKIHLNVEQRHFF